jgi:oxalate---CoA ligase
VHGAPGQAVWRATSRRDDSIGGRSPGAVNEPNRDQAASRAPAPPKGKGPERPGVITEYATGGAPGAFAPDGWLDTGDLGHLDRDGYLFLAGRSDDVINRGGEKIYPGEIEDFLLAQPGVRSAAVVGARDEVLGQRPVAYVVPARPAGPENAQLKGTQLEAAQLEGTQLEAAQLEDAQPEDAQPEDAQLEAALRTACEASLPRPQRPAAYYLVGQLPVGPTGKGAPARARRVCGPAHPWYRRLAVRKPPIR